MAIVEFLRLSPRSTALGAGVVLCGAIAYMIWFVSRQWSAPALPERIDMAYYYDQNTGQVFEAPSGIKGPLETPSGPYQGMPAGVRARMASCGKCWDPEQRFVAWLEVSAEALQAAGITLPRPPAKREEQSDLLIRRPGDRNWVYPDSHEGARIKREAHSRCTGEHTYFVCLPRRKLASDVEPAYRQALAEAERRAAAQLQEELRNKPPATEDE